MKEPANLGGLTLTYRHGTAALRGNSAAFVQPTHLPIPWGKGSGSAFVITSLCDGSFQRASRPQKRKRPPTGGLSVWNPNWIGYQLVQAFFCLAILLVHDVDDGVSAA